MPFKVIETGELVFYEDFDTWNNWFSNKDLKTGYCYKYGYNHNGGRECYNKQWFRKMEKYKYSKIAIERWNGIPDIKIAVKHKYPRNFLFTEDVILNIAVILKNTRNQHFTIHHRIEEDGGRQRHYITYEPFVIA